MKAIHLFKKYFIPGEHNDHKPHVLRTEMTLFFLVGILVVEMLFLLQIFVVYPKTNYFAEVLPSVVAGLANEDRETERLPELKTNSLLEKAAQMKADDMAKRGYFAHNAPDGTTPWDWLDKAGYVYDYAGENLAINFYDSNDVNQAWMNSVAHRKNILNANFTEIGIAAAKGMYKGKDTIFIVQMFGRPAKKEIERRPVAVTRVQEKIITPSSSVKLEASEEQGDARDAQGGTVSGVFLEAATSGEQTVAIASTKVSLFKKMITMPRLAVAYVYFVLLTVVSLALVLKVFIKIRVQHSELIINGIILLIIMTTALAINQRVVLLYANISSSIN